MATGMEMMLKSFGIDPQQIKEQVAAMGQMVIDFKAQMDRIEAQNALILTHLGVNTDGQQIPPAKQSDANHAAKNGSR